MKNLPRPYLLPFNLIYGFVTTLRNLLYDLGVLRSERFPMPVVALGNLNTGGTGKTPHTEYLIRSLKDRYRIAVLSRGYGRRSKGFQIAGKWPLVSLVGDEPAQMKRKFEDVTVAVDADRVHGIKTLLRGQQPPEVILLDDAFQHRSLQAGFYVLLTSYHNLYIQDWLLPAGNLREHPSGAKRANAIVVTKCPAGLPYAERQKIKERLQPGVHQQVYFTSLRYGKISGNKDQFHPDQPFLLITGIADDSPLLDYLGQKNLRYRHLRFGDHHHYTSSDYSNMAGTASAFGCTQILTTEKDYVRMDLEKMERASISVFYLPVEVSFIADEDRFQLQLDQFIQMQLTDSLR